MSDTYLVDLELTYAGWTEIEAESYADALTKAAQLTLVQPELDDLIDVSALRVITREDFNAQDSDWENAAGWWEPGDDDEEPTAAPTAGAEVRSP